MYESVSKHMILTILTMFQSHPWLSGHGRTNVYKSNAHAVMGSFLGCALSLQIDGGYKFPQLINLASILPVLIRVKKYLGQTAQFTNWSNLS